MPAHIRVRSSEIHAALEATGGNIQGAARRVGMAPNNLRKRLESERVDVNEAREAARLRGDSIRGLRIKQRRHEELRQAAFDLSYIMRREYGPEEVIEEFLGDAFGPWLQAKCASARA
jgi:hypothetical protein